MTFPTKADIEFFKEAKGIQEGWEPKFGDLLFTNTKHLAIFVGLDPFAHDDKGDRLLVLAGEGDTDYLWHKYASNVIWLPRQGQLQEILEERGRLICKENRLPRPDYHIEIRLIKRVWGYSVDYSVPGESARVDGPTPSIALGRALIEVLEKEE